MPLPPSYFALMNAVSPFVYLWGDIINHKNVAARVNVTGVDPSRSGFEPGSRCLFQCSICMSAPVVPPVIYARCCKCLLGCQSCLDTWYGGEKGKMKKCPICRNETVYAETAILKGFDALLQAIALILGKEQDERASIYLLLCEWGAWPLSICPNHSSVLTNCVTIQAQVKTVPPPKMSSIYTSTITETHE